jgi:hypothetical protein
MIFGMLSEPGNAMDFDNLYPVWEDSSIDDDALITQEGSFFGLHGVIGVDLDDPVSTDPDYFDTSDLESSAGQPEPPAQELAEIDQEYVSEASSLERIRTLIQGPSQPSVLPVW